MKLKTLFASMICMVIVIAAAAQSTKKQDYSFASSTGTILNIQNSFGDIEIEEFGGSKIEINIEIIVEAKNVKNTEEYLSKIYVETKEQGNNVFLKTVNELKGTKVKNFQINYDVKIPKNTDVKISNSFGDIKVRSITGSVHLTVQHGDCFMGNIAGNKNVLDVSFGDIRVIESGDIQIVAKHGDISLGKITHLKLNSQFGDATIQDLRGDADINIMHGDFTIESLGSKVQQIIVKAQFSDIEIEGLEGLDFKIALEGSFTDFDFGSTWYVKHSKKDYNTKGYELYVNGNGAPGVKILSINASHSDVDLE